MEKSTIREAYLEKRGNVKHIIKRVPFLSDEDEPRVIALLKGEIYAIKLRNVVLINSSIYQNGLPPVKYPITSKSRDTKGVNQILIHVAVTVVVVEMNEKW